MRSNGLQVVRNADMVGGLLLSASASFTRINLHRLIPSPRLLRVHTSVTSSSGCAIGNPPLPLELLILSRDAGCKRVLMLSVSASTRSVDSICTKNPIPSHRSADSVDCRRKNRLCAYAAAYLFAALPHAPLLLLQHRLRVGESCPWSSKPGVLREATPRASRARGCCSQSTAARGPKQQVVLTSVV
jgi:hypothetical protein